MAGTKDDEAARKARAARLRRQIGAVLAGQGTRPPRSPREFIEEKMREKAPPPRRAPKARPRKRAR